MRYSKQCIANSRIMQPSDKNFLNQSSADKTIVLRMHNKLQQPFSKHSILHVCFSGFDIRLPIPSVSFR